MNDRLRKRIEALSEGKTTITVQEGDLLSIPVDNVLVVAKVLWVSQWYRNVMGIAVHAGLHDAVTAAPDTLPGYLTFDMGGEPVTILYPSVDNVTKKKTWTIIGHRPLDDVDKGLRRHIIGGTLYDGDDEIRQPASGEDYTLYPVVRTAPALVVVNLIRAAMDQPPASEVRE